MVRLAQKRVEKMSLEVEEFIEKHFLKKLSLYEKIARTFSFLPIPVPKSVRKRLEEEIIFTHLRITPEQAFRVSFTLPLILFLISFLLNFFGVIDFGSFLVLIFADFILFYFLWNYTKYYSYYFRSKAASEMVLSILYMSIALRVRPNLENAIFYAAENLTGPLGLDFKKGFYDIYTKKKLSAIEVLDEISEKWKVESGEFVDALELIKGGIVSGKLEKNLERALDIVINGTIRRMEAYAYELRTPLTLITMFGITLPLMMLVGLPVFLFFLPEILSPQMMALSYNLVLPFIVYILFFQNLFRRSFSYHQLEVPIARKIKVRAGIISFLSFILIISFFLLFLLFTDFKLFNEFQFFISLLLVFFLSLPFCLYYLLIWIKTAKIGSQIIKMESELPRTLSLLSTQLKFGKPLEKVIEDFLPRIGEMEIKKFFERCVSNLRIGLTLNRAFFHEKVGAVKQYPSPLLKMISRVMVDVAKVGSAFLSSALEDLSKFLEKVEKLDFKVREVLSEVVHEIKINSLAVAPLTAGIVVGLIVMVLAIFFYFRGSIRGIENFFQQYGTIGSLASFGFWNLFNTSKLIPSSIFQLIVGIYLIELTLLLSFFYNELVFGGNENEKSKNTLKNLLITIPFYLLIVLLIYLALNVFTNMKELAELVV